MLLCFTRWISNLITNVVLHHSCFLHLKAVLMNKTNIMHGLRGDHEMLMWPSHGGNIGITTRHDCVFAVVLVFLL